MTAAFEERLQEIDAYLTLLDALERAIRNGPPRIGGETITAQQQRILYSSVYLQLYNLVEATATWCFEAVAAAAADGARWHPGDLSAELRREWVKSHARTHEVMNEENRLEAAVVLCDRLIRSLPISDWEIKAGGGGNWDDEMLEDITKRIGLPMRISTEAFRAAKRHFRDELGALKVVKDLRNRLAHGSISFTDCGDNVTVAQLRDLKERTVLYLREVVRVFREFIDGYSFLVPERRPGGGVA